ASGVSDLPTRNRDRPESRHGSLGQQRTPNRVGLACDNCQEGPSRAAGNPAPMLPMFQSPLAQTEQLRKFALRKRAPLPDLPHIDLSRDVYFAAVIFLALRESQRLSCALDYPFARGWFSLLHLDLIVDV